MISPLKQSKKADILLIATEIHVPLLQCNVFHSKIECSLLLIEMFCILQNKKHEVINIS